MAAVTLAAIAGFFGGSGFFSDAQAAAGANFTVRYLRFCRAHAPHHLSVEWRPRDAVTTLWIAHSYLDSVEIKHVTPAPDRAEVGAGRVYYTFRVREPGTPIRVRFTLESVRAGTADGRIGIDDGREVAIRQFAFP